MEVMITSPPAEFNFDSACTTPYISAPSSPQRFGNFFYSAPASPARVSAAAGVGGCRVPFDWEEEPGVPKPKDEDDDEISDEFAFDFSGQLEKTASFSAADELFDGGKIKPLKPPPRLQYEGKPPDSPKSPRSPKQMFKEAFSPRHRRRDFDPFSAALEQSRKDENDSSSNQRRGRERNTDPTAVRSNSRHKGTRSLSPFRISDLLLDRDETSQENTCSSSSSSASVSSFISMWYRKWKLKDLLLFRSASEGRASSKELMNKYAMLKKSHQDDVKNSSFRSTESVGSTSRRRGPVSAHELHYTVNRAVSEEMKRKTFLPYKQGLLGCLGFHPTVPEISKGLASMSMPRSRQQ